MPNKRPTWWMDGLGVRSTYIHYCGTLQHNTSCAELDWTGRASNDMAACRALVKPGSVSSPLHAVHLLFSLGGFLPNCSSDIDGVCCIVSCSLSFFFALFFLFYTTFLVVCFCFPTTCMHPTSSPLASPSSSLLLQVFVRSVHPSRPVFPCFLSTPASYSRVSS